MDVYLANTPYHLVLSMLNGCLEKPSFVYLIDMQGNLKWYSHARVARFFNDRFAYVDLSCKFTVAKLPNKVPILGQLLKSPVEKIKSELRKINVSRVYVFNDSFPEMQNILASMRGGAVYIEDGSAPYNSHRISYGIKAPLLRKMIYGRKFEPILTLGTSNYISEGIFMFPELVREEHRQRPSRSLSVFDTRLKQLRSFAELFEVSCDVNIARAPKCAIFLIPPKPDETYLDMLSKHIKCSLESRIIPIVKSHPLQPFDGKQIEGTIVIESHIPVELLLCRYENIIGTIGYPSTALMYMRRLYPAKYAKYIPINGQRDRVFESNLAKIGVTPLHN